MLEYLVYADMYYVDNCYKIIHYLENQIYLENGNPDFQSHILHNKIIVQLAVGYNKMIWYHLK